jgi:hypothetical protein
MALACSTYDWLTLADLAALLDAFPFSRSGIISLSGIVSPLFKVEAFLSFASRSSSGSEFVATAARCEAVSSRRCRLTRATKKPPPFESGS